MFKFAKTLFFLILLFQPFFLLRATESLVYPHSLAQVKTELEFNQIPSITTQALTYLQKNNEASLRLICVRHGESNSNKEKSIAGRTLETDLSQKGIEQAIEIGAALNAIHLNIDQVFSSPSLRAMQTTEILLSQLQTPLQIQQDGRLLEKWYGPYEGATEKEYAPIKKKEEKEISQLDSFAEKFSYKPDPNMESIQDVYLRMTNFIEELNQSSVGKNILIVTHNSCLKSLFMADAAFDGFDVEYRSFDLGNCAVIVLEINADRTFKVAASKGLKFRR